jgi:hypothetical protein
MEKILWPCSIAMLVYQTIGYIIDIGIPIYIYYIYIGYLAISMAIFPWEIHNSPFFSGRVRWSHSNLPGFGSLAFVVSLLPVSHRKNGVGDNFMG